jgi:hypothetical protein
MKQYNFVFCILYFVFCILNFEFEINSSLKIYSEGFFFIIMKQYNFVFCILNFEFEINSSLKIDFN